MNIERVQTAININGKSYIMKTRVNVIILRIVFRMSRLVYLVVMTVLKLQFLKYAFRRLFYYEL